MEPDNPVKPVGTGCGKGSVQTAKVSYAGAVMNMISVALPQAWGYRADSCGHIWVANYFIYSCN